MTLSVDAVQSLAAQETDEAYLVLLTVMDHRYIVLERFTSDSVDTVNANGTFKSYPFSLTLPDAREGQETRAQLTLTNVDQRLIDDLRTLAENLYVTIQVVLGSNPNDVMASYFNMEMRQITYDTSVIAGTLSYESFSSESYPKDIMTGRYFPGLFKT